MAPMTFNIVAMICVAGMAPQDCAPVPGFSRTHSIIGEAPNEIECARRATLDPAKDSIFRDLAPGEFIKTMCLRNG